MFDTSSQRFQRQDDQEVDAHLFMFLSSPKQTKCTLENDVIYRFYVYRKPISSPRSRNLKVIKKMCSQTY
jgi:hypothetical protein